MCKDREWGPISALWDFEKTFFELIFSWTRARRGLILAPAVNFNACGYCFDLMLCEKIDLKFKVN